MRFLCTVLASIVLLAGCSSGNILPHKDKNPLTGRPVNYQTQAAITGETISSSAEILHNTDGCTVKFTSPPAVEGMEFKFDGDTVSLLFNGLDFNFDPQSLPSTAPAQIIVSALNTAILDSTVETEKVGDLLKITGTVDAGNFDLFVDPQTGTPVKLLLPSRELEIGFDNFSFFD